jgi:hypothetical protein
MILPTNISGSGDGSFLGERVGVAVLEFPFALDNQFCRECKREDVRFVFEFIFANGLLRTCVRCGDERVAVLGKNYD